MYVFSLPVQFYLTRVDLPVPECGKGPGPGWEPDWVTDMISLMDYTRLLDSGAFINFMIENIYNKVEKMIPCNLFLTTRRGLGTTTKSVYFLRPINWEVVAQILLASAYKNAAI